MSNPYDLLGVAEGATDEAIKKAYLQKVRQFPPEQAAEQFQQIRAAYEKICTHKDRLRYALFDVDKPDVSAVLLQTMGTAAFQRPDADTFTKALAASLVSAKRG